MTLDSWLNFCQTFKISIDRIKTGAKIPIPGYRIDVYIYQSYFVYWVRIQERTDTNRGIFADEMGLGKTVFALLIYIVEKWIAIADADVEKDRKRKTSVYLPVLINIY